MVLSGHLYCLLKLARLTIAAEPVQASLPKLGHGAPFDNLS
jgi:hypothetical protein